MTSRDVIVHYADKLEKKVTAIRVRRIESKYTQVTLQYTNIQRKQGLDGKLHSGLHSGSSFATNLNGRHVIA
jgi:hypothetical protein